ncbi:histidine--tRNA ligase, partial [bacterium]|nr:histidine--tRNA ligase [bacterium]
MSKKLKFQSPTGMHDILLEEQKYFQKIYEVCEDIANFYQFQKIETPILEETELFSRGIGFSTDIVGKQMFTLRTKGGDYLTLRPEFTASIVRAYIEHGMFNLPQPVKLWYFGPCFRYEHPQAGRFRQFWQFGFEVLGEESPVIDTQVIQIFYNILREIRLKKLIIEINSIGDNQCRPYYKKLLVSYFRSREMALCADCRRRLRENPLRILDCKEEKCQRIISQAPQMIDHLCESCHSHFKEVLEFLDEIGLPYHLNPYLVRGLDYYTKTVFEIYEESPEGRALGALAGGGRYDALTKLLGGKDTPGCGG